MIPDNDSLERHARRLFEQKLAKELLDAACEEIAAKAAAHAPPPDLGARVVEMLADRPELPWDTAVALALGIREF